MEVHSSAESGDLGASSIQAFEEYALEYDSWYIDHPSIFESEVRAIEALGLSGSGLEVGVGTGVFAGRLSVGVGVDPSRGMLLIAKRRGVQVVRGVGEFLPFQGVCFDYLLVAGTLCFLEKPSDALSEARRVLKRGGSLILCEVPRDSSWGRAIEEKGMAGHRFYSRARLYTVREMRQLLEDAGFNVVDVRSTLSFGPHEPERAEEPSPEVEGKSFVCILARVPVGHHLPHETPRQIKQI